MHDITVYPIARTQMIPNKWFGSKYGTNLAGLAAKRCYMSFEVGMNPNVKKIREDWTEYLDNILKSGHGSVLEHVSWTWAIEGCTRVFTGEMNRHRAGVAISEGSMRYIRFDESIPYWIPLSIRGDDVNSVQTRRIFEETFAYIHAQYMRLCELWNIDAQTFADKKKLTSMFRRLLPMGTQTGGIWTMNIRALRHIIALRTSPAAEEEIAFIIGKIAAVMISEECDLFQDFECIDGQYVPKYVKV